MSQPRSHLTIEDHFAARAGRTPSATAVVDGGRRVSYAELWHGATALAARLAEAGVGRETPVGLLARRSASTVTALVGTVLAGGAYVPLGPDLPARRVAELVNDNGLRLLILASEFAARLADTPLPGVTVIDLEAGIASSGPVPDPVNFRSPPPLDARSPLAYVMFTSGSTGRPKGVMVEHAGVLRLVRDADYFPFGADHRFLHGAPLEFDASTFEIWGALLNGAELHVADEDTMLVPDRFRGFLAAHGITAAWLTAPLFHQLADDDPDLFAPLAYLLTGGDVVSAAHVARVRQSHPALTVLNCYGPTENTTFTTVHRVVETTGDLPLGRPVAGTEVDVRDGELVVSGAGVARGYLNEPELTAARFSDSDGVRRYRTGDRCRIDADGLIHFQGRVDDQVKIRGRLVEPAEVRAALAAVPGVHEAWVTVLGDDGRSRSLAAYVVAPGVSEDRIRAGLAERVPPYLCPDHIVSLDRLPLNRNGKVDRNALPNPATGTALDERTGLSADQVRMADLWARALNLDTAAVRAHTGFRALGGNSLLVGRLIGEIGREWGRWPTFAALSAANTLAGMTAAAADAPAERPITIPRTGARTSMIHPQQRRIYAIWQAHPESVVYNIPARIAIRGELDRRLFEDSVRATLAAHDAFALRFTVDDGDIKQHAVADGVPDVRWHHGSGPPPDFPLPFAPDEPVAARAVLTRRAPGCHELYLDAHHIAFDGASLRIIVREIVDRCLGVPVSTSAVAYTDASQWFHDRLASGALAAAEAEQQAVLAGWRPAPLPTDRPRPARPVGPAGRVRRELPSDRLRAVTQAAGAHGVTLYVFLLTGYFTVLARLSGHRDVVVGSPAEGRNAHPDLAEVVGMFVSTVAIRARWDADRTFAELIGQVEAESRRTLDRQDVPYDRLRIDPVAVLFALRDNTESSRGGLSAEVEVLGTRAARFEFDLQAWPSGGGLVFELFYTTDLYDRSSADCLIDEYLAVLDEMVDRPDAPTCPVAAGAAAVSIPEFDF